ncbi:hypothetical protein DFH28DRAFT_1018656 [Melampsora americana]|nr:hypothetical protein DFH28DRAFT_1018656 [Melampsora americana]
MSITNYSTSTSTDSRLYVGNLAPAVDEFALVALFSKFGKISKLDFLFHKSGILRGKPRGYAFIEMSRKDEALKAMIELNNKPLRGKRILVTPANESQYPEQQVTTSSKPNYHNKNQSVHDGRHSGQHGRGSTFDPTRPTTLSLLKSQQQPKGVNNKIAALEAKLASMQQTKLAALDQSASHHDAKSADTPKPASLPEHPKTWLTNPPPPTKTRNNPSTHRTGQRGSQVFQTNSSQSSTSSHPYHKHMDSVGLTLKEQLRRNRDSHLSAGPDTSSKAIGKASSHGSTASDIANQSSGQLLLKPHSPAETDDLLPLQDPHTDTPASDIPESAQCHMVHSLSKDTHSSSEHVSSTVRPSSSPTHDDRSGDARIQKVAHTPDDHQRIIKPIDGSNPSKDIFKPIKPDLSKISWSSKRI